jgi:hypothetical protein
MSLTVPSTGEGTSIVALSDSSEISGSSAFTASPILTNTPITGTSLKSPMSGVLTSTVVAMALPPGGQNGQARVERLDGGLEVIDETGTMTSEPLRYRAFGHWRRAPPERHLVDPNSPARSGIGAIPAGDSSQAPDQQNVCNDHVRTYAPVFDGVGL